METSNKRKQTKKRRPGSGSATKASAFRFGPPNNKSNLKKRRSQKHPLSNELSKLTLDIPSSSGKNNKIDEDVDSSADENEELFTPTTGRHKSRIRDEYEFLEPIGKGAYGVVLKYKNKLDRKTYAIKKIKLNPKKVALNKKIIREVKLLSRLNHENVVRYFYSWIESLDSDDDDDFSISTISSEDESEINIADFSDPDVELKAQSLCSDGYRKTPALSNGYAFSDVLLSCDDDDLDYDTDDDTPSSSSDGFDFENCNRDAIGRLRMLHSSPNLINCYDTIVEMGADENITRRIRKQYLYIQMELCEKNTLRNAIDQDLHLDKERMWRLFREVVEGLNHIHQKGMIHRDLKPDNIFIDSNDHVKIGDFGWATILPTKITPPSVIVKTSDEIDAQLQNGALFTGYAGTALYVAPEIDSTQKRAIYNQKVDIYSLGIILFEMTNPPLNTGMERIKILEKLRLKDIIMPLDFINAENNNKIELIRWLLDHNDVIRPSCADLLHSEKLPFYMEKKMIKNVLHHTISDKNSHAYRQLIKNCFEKEFTTTENMEYDRFFLKSTTGFDYKQSLLISKIKDKVEKIFKLHGGVELITPLLMPSCQLYNPDESGVRLMTHDGNVVYIPYDLRLPFARYVALNGITMMRRYSIERIYRETNIHPKEFYECSFDIVNQSRHDDRFAEAELLAIVNKIVNELPSLNRRRSCILLNHTGLFNALLTNMGIEPKVIDELRNILSQGRLNRSQILTHFTSLYIPHQVFQFLFVEMELPRSIEQLKNKILLRGYKQTEMAMHELQLIEQHARAMGVTCPIYILPLMVLKGNYYSGMVYKFVCYQKNKKRNDRKEIAVGGRYDEMLRNMRDSFKCASSDDTYKEKSQFAVGVSISLEHLIEVTANNKDESRSLYDIYLCSIIYTDDALTTKAGIASNLWKNGIRTSLIEYNDIEKIDKGLSKSYVIIVDSDPKTVELKCLYSSFQRKIEIKKLVNYIKSLVKTNKEKPQSTTPHESQSGSAASFYKSQPII